MNPCKNEQEYIDQIYLAAQKACAKYGYLPSVLIAQACLENGYGIPSYWDNPQIELLIKYWNMVGIKSELLNKSWTDIGLSVWNGESLTKKTPEVYDGKKVIITDNFRKYDSAEESFVDYLLFMTYASNYGPGGEPKYGRAVLDIKDPEKLITEVNRRGYTTGTTYPSSVMKIVRKHDLTKYDALAGIKPTDMIPPALRDDPDPQKEKTAKGKKVMLDAGHYGYYNQSPAVKEYWESKMTWKLHLMLKEELEKYGITVGTTRKDQAKDMALYDRGYASKGYDLLLSIHSNAVGDNVNEKVDYPVCFVQISGKSDKIGTLLSECVHDVMGTSQPADHWSQKGNNGDYYGVLRGATAAGTVGCIIEHSFHTQTRATKWLLQDSNLRKMAVAEAKVINDYLCGASPTPTKDYITIGDKGEAVKEMQEMLIACGYSCGGSGADGIFGQQTGAALKSFKHDHGMLTNDHYGEKTAEKLKAVYKEITKSFTTKFLASCQNVVDTARKSGWKYGDSQKMPPCSDGLISCDRLVARALYNMGYTDQRTGGEVCGTLPDWLPAHGWKKILKKKNIKPGAVIAVRRTSHDWIDHVFVVKTYDVNTDRCDKYDTGSDERIRTVQPFKNVPLVEWSDRVFVCAWNPPSDASGDGSGTTWNGVNYKAVYNYTYYRKKYADLRKAFGTEKKKYFEHFCQYGMKEARQASANFNVKAYKARYQDLRKAFGDNLPEYYKHYCLFGKKEGRNGK